VEDSEVLEEREREALEDRDVLGEEEG
jgi:hypothetical protein